MKSPLQVRLWLHPSQLTSPASVLTMWDPHGRQTCHVITKCYNPPCIQWSAFVCGALPVEDVAGAEGAEVPPMAFKDSQMRYVSKYLQTELRFQHVSDCGYLPMLICKALQLQRPSPRNKACGQVDTASLLQPKLWRSPATSEYVQICSNRLKLTGISAREGIQLMCPLAPHSSKEAGLLHSSSSVMPWVLCMPRRNWLASFIFKRACPLILLITALARPMGAQVPPKPVRKECWQVWMHFRLQCCCHRALVVV